MSPVLNLCFHGIGTPEREREPGEAAYWISRDLFLHTLDLVAACATDHGAAPIGLSFDDGNVSDADIAAPALVERGLSASFFVLAGRFGTPGSLDVDDVQMLVDAGMRIGSHGADHRPWRGLSEADAHHELVEARETIAEVSGQPVDAAALPLGRYDRTVLSRLRRLGYTEVNTSDRRWARPGAWIQPRFSIRADDTSTSVRALLDPPSLRRRARSHLIGTVKALRP